MILILLISLNAFFNAFGATVRPNAHPTAPTVSVPTPLLKAMAPAIQAFTEETERDLTLKHEVPLYLQHTLGSISVQGWVQDRIRIKIKKRVLAANETLARAEMKKLDLVTLETAQAFELRIGHSRGSDIVTKLREEKQTNVTVDLEIKAPYQMALTILLGDQKELSLQQWKGAFHLSGKNSALTLSRLNLQEDARVNCQNCELNLSDSKVRGHFLVGNRNVVLKEVESTKESFIDSTSGEIRLEQTSGKISVHSVSGRLSSLDHHGLLTFQSEDGGIFASGLRGSVEATTQSGQIMIDADEVDHSLHLDSEKSDIQATLPAKFEGLLDLLSLRGEVVVQFPNEPNKNKLNDTYGPVSPGRVDAIVGARHDVSIHAYSKQGGVRILRKVPKR